VYHDHIISPYSQDYER
jgi:hypothetical protein